MIGGFIITGTENKRMLLRGLGPSIGVPQPILDPVLELRNADGSLITRNDDWKELQRTEIEQTNSAPRDERESAIIATLRPGLYTAIVTNKNGVTGVALFDAYDLNVNAQSRVANISTRGPVRTDAEILIGGFILGGNSTTPTEVVIRALGPSLRRAGIIAPLADPVLELRDANGVLITDNDDWQNNPTAAARLRELALAPEENAESAIVFVLPPGQYTALVAGKNRGIGIGLVEIYQIP